MLFSQCFYIIEKLLLISHTFLLLFCPPLSRYKFQNCPISKKRKRKETTHLEILSPLPFNPLIDETTEVFQSKCIHRGDGGLIRIVVIRRVVTAILRELCNLVTVAQRNCGKVVDTFRKVVGCINTGGYHGTRA